MQQAAGNNVVNRKIGEEQKPPAPLR